MDWIGLDPLRRLVPLEHLAVLIIMKIGVMVMVIVMLMPMLGVFLL